jgi:hypothetical protein
MTIGVRTERLDLVLWQHQPVTMPVRHPFRTSRAAPQPMGAHDLSLAS